MNRVLIIAVAFSLAAWAVIIWGAMSIIDFIRRGCIA
jgi:hypothetical protein